MTDWPFEAVAAAKKRFDRRRVDLMHALANWTSGSADYKAVGPAFAALQAELESFKHVAHALRSRQGRPRAPHDRFDVQGNIACTDPSSRETSADFAER